MLRGKSNDGDPNVRLSAATASYLLPWLLAIGFGVGLLSGFFGIGGGFLIVPGLMLATGMPLANAVGTSLVAVTAFGLTTAGSYAASGLVDWWLAALLLGGGAAGSFAGARLNAVLAERKRLMTVLFASVVLITGVAVAGRGMFAVLAA